MVGRVQKKIHSKKQGRCRTGRDATIDKRLPLKIGKHLRLTELTKERRINLLAPWMLKHYLDSKMISTLNRLWKMQLSNRVSSETLIRNHFNINSRSYYTNTRNKETLYSKISPLGNPSLNLAPELDDWVQKGNKVRFAELQRIVQDLRKRRRVSQALEVSEWMSKKGVCTFTPTEHAIQLDLIGKVHGFLAAESYFNQLSDQDKTDKTYGALLHSYVRQRQTEKSLSHLQKMKEKGFSLSPLTYNDIMSLYTNVGEYENVHKTLTVMKKNGVSPDNLSYRIRINSYGVKSDIKGMESILKEMETQPQIVMDWNTFTVVANFYIKADLKDKANDALKKAEARLDNKDGLGYNHLISLHARVGNKGGVLRLWNLQKSACKRCINKDYIVVLQSLVRLEDFEEAEKLLEEWELSDNCYDFRVPNVLIIGYSENGNYEKAKALLEGLVEKRKSTTPQSWGRVAEGYLKKGEMGKATSCMKLAISLHGESNKWKPNPKVVRSILSLLGEKGSIKEVDDFVRSLRTVKGVNKEAYYALMKAYIRGGKEWVEFLMR
ncbi:hypothetical protein LguiA_036158 [Lonicera macranthoides]